MTNTPNSLRNITIASPCNQAWDEMVGDDVSRFCQQCQLNVYHLSNMTQQQAEQLILEKEGRLCVRFYQRDDGTILTQDCPWKLTQLRRSLMRVAGVLLAAMLSWTSTSEVSAEPPSSQSTSVSQPTVYPGNPVMGSPAPVMGEMLPPQPQRIVPMPPPHQPAVLMGKPAASGVKTNTPPKKRWFGWW